MRIIRLLIKLFGKRGKMTKEETYKAVEETYERLEELFPHGPKQFLMELASEMILKNIKIHPKLAIDLQKCKEIKNDNF